MWRAPNRSYTTREEPPDALRLDERRAFIDLRAAVFRAGLRAVLRADLRAGFLAVLRAAFRFAGLRATFLRADVFRFAVLRAGFLAVLRADVFRFAVLRAGLRAVAFRFDVLRIAALRATRLRAELLRFAGLRATFLRAEVFRFAVLRAVVFRFTLLRAADGLRRAEADLRTVRFFVAVLRFAVFTGMLHPFV